ncbi:Cof-type HAD-IIB family hydrolase [Paenarthrobacter sp. NPDC089322]|uniref:Cof-type HAD-IIB family hydrolase n=1 Tax=Paenarthrobacter sp. NPDC089322 TaxID=3155065 RepID=UPI003441C140
MAMFCTDIDGTLLNPDRTLSPRTIDAVRAVRAAGHNFVLCSSRMPESMRILERLYDGADEPLIAYNGGLVLSRTGAVVHDIAIAPEHARKIAGYCAEFDLHASFFAGEAWHVWGEDQWTAREINNTGVSPHPMSSKEYVSSGRVEINPPHKIMCMGEQSLVDGIEALLIAEPGVVTYRSKDTYLEIANAACSKGLGVEAAAQELGYSKDDCYFFGDNYNDIPAFAAVGTSIAVANGKQAVLEAATITTSRHHDDGVAAYLESWLAAGSQLDA